MYLQYVTYVNNKYGINGLWPTVIYLLYIRLNGLKKYIKKTERVDGVLDKFRTCHPSNTRQKHYSWKHLAVSYHVLTEGN